MLREFADKELEEILIEREVGIEISDEIKGNIFYGGIAGIEGPDLAGEVPFPAFGHPHELHPVMSGAVLQNLLLGSVSRPVADDNPADRFVCLGDHRPDSPFDALGLVASRRDQYKG